MSLSAVLVGPALAAPVPVLSNTHVEASWSVPPALQGDALDTRTDQRRMVAEMGDVRVSSIRLPVDVSRVGEAKIDAFDSFDPFNAFYTFRTDFHEHWSVDRGGPLRQRFGRPVYPGLLGGFGHFGDAIYAAHARFRPVYESGLGTNQLTGWLHGEFEELAELFDLFAGARLIAPIRDRFPGEPTGEIVAIPLPGSAAMALAGMVIIASRRRR